VRPPLSPTDEVRKMRAISALAAVPTVAAQDVTRTHPGRSHRAGSYAS